ncbi:MAG: NUDIX hydrolase [Ignavibacteria bacterium]|nr:NUDIX hydrolase [Ignavibacteria bacterium]
MSEIKYKLIADVSLFTKKNILLIKYNDANKYDHQSGWFLPDDLLLDFEHPEDAAVRILKEQLNLSEIIPVLNHVESFKGNDSSWHLVFHYKAELSDIPEINFSEDIISIQWFETNKLPEKNDVAHHGWALYTIDEIIKN